MYDLYVLQVAGSKGNVERVTDVSLNDMKVEVDSSRVSRGASAGEPVRPTVMGVPSDGGEEAVAPRVPLPCHQWRVRKHWSVT